MFNEPKDFLQSFNKYNYANLYLRQELLKRESKDRLELIQNAKNINEKDKGRLSILEIAVTNYPELIPFIVQKKANLNIQTHHDSTPLILSLAECSDLAINALLEGGADINFPTNKNLYPLIFVIEHRPQYFDLLMNKKPNINCRDHSSKTALMLACQWSKFVLAKKLIQAGADINLANDKGQTALMLAVLSKNLPSIQFLLNHNADVEKEDTYYDTVFTIAEKMDFDFLSICNSFTENRTLRNDLINNCSKKIKVL